MYTAREVFMQWYFSLNHIFTEKYIFLSSFHSERLYNVSSSTKADYSPVPTPININIRIFIGLSGGQAALKMFCRFMPKNLYISKIFCTFAPDLGAFDETRSNSCKICNSWIKRYERRNSIISAK